MDGSDLEKAPLFNCSAPEADREICFPSLCCTHQSSTARAYCLVIPEKDASERKLVQDLRLVNAKGLRLVKRRNRLVQHPCLKLDSRNMHFQVVRALPGL